MAGREDDVPPDTFRIYVSEEKDILDVTGNQLKDLSEIDLPETLVELDLTTNRLSSIDPRIGSLRNLQKISFRQNLLTDATVADLSVHPGFSSLKELVLRDNLLKKIPPLGPLVSLTLLDLSYNEISSMDGIGNVAPGLKELYLANNRIGEVEELEKLTALTLLELGSNKIRVMQNLEHLTSLQELWLGRNKIKEINLCGLSTSLTRVSIQSNRLTCMKGLEACVNLEELYLSHNGITAIEALETLTKLKILDLAGNRIEKVPGLDTLKSLKDLWLNDNAIASLDDFMASLDGPKESLTTLYLERNPCVEVEDYRKKLGHLLPNIEEIDSEAVYR